jgi:outer membrane scaffolding protein for murein synthesis (MipA/OmpV family)
VPAFDSHARKAALIPTPTPSTLLRPSVLAAVLAAAPLALHAQDTVADTSGATAPSSPREPLPLWEIGAVAIAAYQPAYPGSDQDFARLRILPFGIDRGSVLHADGNGIGVRALRTPRWEWDVSGSGSFGSSANKVDARRGMPAIGTMVEVGPAVKVNLGDLLEARREPRLTQLELPVRAVFDVNDGLAHHGWTFEPRLSHTAWTGRSFSLVVSAGTLFGDRTLNHLYYGVDVPYATAARPAYEARAGLIATRLNASLRHRINPTLRLFYFAQLETVRGAANEASPLVRRKQDAGFGVSLIWGVWHSSEAGVE